MALRIIFMGTPEFSVPILQAIEAAGHDVCCVYSQPPRAGGRRGMELVKTPVHQAADALDIEVRTPLNFKDAAEVQAFAELNADVAVVVAYGLLLPKALLDAPKFGCLNGHASLLPRWRGAAPIQRAIMAGDTETGMMVMRMETGLDTGPVGLTATRAITSEMTAGELHDQLMQVGAELMVEALSKLQAGELSFVAQSDEGAIYAKKIEKSETRIDWNRSATEVHNHIRGLSPFPGAWCEMELGGKLQRVKILSSKVASGNGAAGQVLDDQITLACNSGAVQLTRLQRAGKQAMEADVFQRGTPLAKDAVLS